MNTKTLTGRTRYRYHTRWLRQPLLVLQVEVRHQGASIQNMGNRVEEVPYDFTTWEDAQADDLRRAVGDDRI